MQPWFKEAMQLLNCLLLVSSVEVFPDMLRLNCPLQARNAMIDLPSVLALAKGSLPLLLPLDIRQVTPYCERWLCLIELKGTLRCPSAMCPLVRAIRLSRIPA